jgi:membrane protease YdiL (CAAX protease family)
MSANMTPTIIGLTIALFGPMLLAIAGERFISPQSPFVLHMLTMGVYLAIVTSVLFIVFHYEHQSLLSIGIRPFRWQTIVWGLVLAAFFMYVFAPVAYWALTRFNLGGFESGLAKTAALPVWYLAISVVFGGISEELLYRGYAIERLAMLTGSYGLAGAISVGIFGLAHIPLWGWGPALTTVVSGTIATAFYIWQRDLVAIIIAHVITDFAGIVVMPYLARTKGF